METYQLILIGIGAAVVILLWLALRFGRRIARALLVSATLLMVALGVGALFVKDESVRFGVKAFKPLGASYAIYHFLAGRWAQCTGTDDFGTESFRDPQRLERLGHRVRVELD